MGSYVLAGISIVTELELPELPVAQAAPEHWTVDRHGGHMDVSGEEMNEATVDGRVWMRILRDGADYLILFPDAAEFRICPDDRRVTFSSQADIGQNTLRHLLLDLVFPHILALDGSIILHASAVLTDGGALVFSGPSGCGKSSLAAEFARYGCQPLSDDFVLLRQGSPFLVVPSYPGLRLWPDSAEEFAESGSELSPVYDGGEKQRLVPAGTRESGDPQPLRAIVSLGPEPGDGPPIQVERMPARQAMMTLFAEAFRMERAGPERAAVEFDRFADLANSIPLFRLCYLRDYADLSRVRERILEVLPATWE